MGFRSIVFKGDILVPILELKEQYFVTKDIDILSKLIQAIEKAEYYLYCRLAEESVASDNTRLTVKVKEVKVKCSKSYSKVRWKLPIILG